MGFWQAYATIAALALVGMLLLWLVSLAIKNASIVDAFWGIGFVVVDGVAIFLFPGGARPRQLLLTALVSLWGLRLSLHLWRRIRRIGEDPRYRAWREKNGPSWWWKSLLQVFLAQGSILCVISAPLVIANMSPIPESLTALDLAAIPIWLLGFAFEMVGDWQLVRFRSDPGNQGRVLRHGLWKYTRHPNYFGDALQWWAFFLVAAAVPRGVFTVLSPLLMTFLLIRVSGVAHLERTLQETKPEYADYIRATSAFVPLPPRRRDP